MKRRLATGEASHRKVEATPEEMHWAHFADEPASEELENTMGLDEYTPETLRRLSIIVSVNPIRRKAYGVRKLAVHFIEPNDDAHVLEQFARPPIKLGDGLEHERNYPLAAAGAGNEAVHNKTGIADVPSPRAVT
jgi:hypothetical protein